MNCADVMLTMRLPTSSPMTDEQQSQSALRRDLVRTERETPRYYGQLVDIEWRPFKVELSDSAASLMCADERANA